MTSAGTRVASGHAASPRFGIWVRTTAGYIAVYLVLQIFLPSPSPFRDAFGLLGFLPLSLATTAAFYRASRAALEPQFRRAFLLYAGSFAATSVGTAIWFWQKSVLGIEPEYSWSNIPYLLSYPFAIGGMLAFPIQRVDRAGRWRIALDAAITILAGGAITWLYIVAPLSQADDLLWHRVLLYAYPMGDLLIFTVLVPLLLSQRGEGVGRVLRMVATGQLVYLAGDLSYQLSGTVITWSKVEWPDVPLAIGYLIMIRATEWFWGNPVTPADIQETATPHRVPRNLMPLLLGVVVYGLVVIVALSEWTPVLSVLAVTAVATTALILAREWITDRQNSRLERALEAERGQARFRSVMNQLHVGVVVHDASGRPTMANPAALAMLGVSETELLARSAFDRAWNVIREDGSPFPVELHPVPQALATGRAVQNVVMGFSRPGSRDRVWLLVSAEPRLRPDGSTEEVACSMLDVTERRELEAKLRQAQRMEAVGQLAGGVAHDFNNIRKAADRAAGLTRQLLAFGRRQLLQPVVLDMNEVIREAERLLHRLLGEDIEIRCDLAADLGLVQVDRGQLEQVIVNLAVNARDAMPRGGTLSITTRNAAPDSTGLPSGLEIPTAGAVLLEMRDSGVGMEEAIRLRAFEPFFTTKEIGKGTGLGLSTVYGIVRQSGGDACIESRVGQGTMVTICLPRMAAATLAPAAPPPAAPVVGGRERVLIVEDEPAIRLVVGRVLSSHGYAVVEAANPAAARALLADAGPPIDLLISDVVMPGGSGPELAAWTRSRWPKLPVLFITGHADEEVLQRGLDLANATVLSKPFTPVDLIAAVRASLDSPS